MNTQEIETAVSELLRRCEVRFAVTLVGATKRDDWECDEWRVDLRTERCTYSLPFYTGIGLRADPTPAQKMQAKYSLPGLTENDIKRGTIYGRRYAAALEKLRSPKAPSAASVMHSLVLDGQAIDQSFTDWCSELGMSDDSRKALQTYEACCESGRKLRQLFTRAQREELAQLLQDY